MRPSTTLKTTCLVLYQLICTQLVLNFRIDWPLDEKPIEYHHMNRHIHPPPAMPTMTPDMVYNRIQTCKKAYPDYDYQNLRPDDQYKLFDRQNPCKIVCIINKERRYLHSIVLRNGQTCGLHKVCQPISHSLGARCVRTDSPASPPSSTWKTTPEPSSYPSTSDATTTKQADTSTSNHTSDLITVNTTESNLNITTKPTKASSTTTSTTTTSTFTTSSSSSTATQKTSDNTSEEPIETTNETTITVLSSSDESVSDSIATESDTTTVSDDGVTDTETPQEATEWATNATSSSTSQTNETIITQNSTSTPSTESTVSTTEEMTYRECRNGEVVRDPTDPECKRYLLCSHGIVYKMSCPDGTILDETEQRASKCVHPDQSRQPCRFYEKSESVHLQGDAIS